MNLRYLNGAIGAAVLVLAIVNLASPDEPWASIETPGGAPGTDENSTTHIEAIRAHDGAGSLTIYINPAREGTEGDLMDVECDGSPEESECSAAKNGMWVANITALIGAVALIGVAVFSERTRLLYAAGVLFVASFISGAVSTASFANSAPLDTEFTYEAFYYLFLFGTVIIPVIWLMITLAEPTLKMLRDNNIMAEM